MVTFFIASTVGGSRQEELSIRRRDYITGDEWNVLLCGADFKELDSLPCPWNVRGGGEVTEERMAHRRRKGESRQLQPVVRHAGFQDDISRLLMLVQYIFIEEGDHTLFTFHF
jgi:hypothetical protein